MLFSMFAILVTINPRCLCTRAEQKPALAAAPRRCAHWEGSVSLLETYLGAAASAVLLTTKGVHMNASKEEVRNARKAMNDIVDIINGNPLGSDVRELAHTNMATVFNFLTVAEKKLPSEAAFAKDKKKKGYVTGKSRGRFE